jgi:Fic family protein
MKLPEPAPKYEDMLYHTKDPAEFLKACFFSPEAQKIYQKANQEYLYWDKFKYTIKGDDQYLKQMWVGLTLQRGMQLKRLPVQDTKGIHFGYWLPPSLSGILHFIDKYGGGQILVDEIVHTGEKERYVINSIMEEAIASSMLEGAATTRRIAKEMLRSDRKPRDKSEKMVKNNYITINYIKEIVDDAAQKNEKPVLTGSFIKELQSKATEDTLDDPYMKGRFRKSDERVVVGDDDGVVLHTPPTAEKIEALIEELCAFANQDGDEFMHPVVKAIIIHFWFAYIHPFVDGNGRTARALFYWYMMREGYWMIEYLSISRIMLKAPSQYLRAFLYSEIADRDLTYFIGYNLKAIRTAIKDLKSYLRRKQKEFQESIRVLGSCRRLNQRQLNLVYHALSHPEFIYSINSHKKIYGVVYQTARSDLLNLVKMGLLNKIKRGNKFLFKVPSNLKERIEKLSHG